MKKYFLSIVALAAMLLATSCQESLVEPQVGGTTTFTVQLPEAMGTKAEIGSANTVNQLFVSVYAPGCESTPLSSAVVEKAEGDGTFTVSFNLIQDQTYDLIFWAQTTNAYVDKSSNENALYDLRKIDISERFYSSENGAAFYAYQTYVIDGQPKEAILKRPFAQLNIGTTVESLKTDADSDIILEGAKIEVRNVASSFNTVTGFGEGDGTTIYGQPSNFVKVAGEDIQVNSNQKYAKLEVEGKSYVYVTMDYLPIISSTTVPKDLVEIKLLIDTDQPTIIEHNFDNVPVQRNYRTNIVGNLISSTTDFIVKVSDDWAGADNNIVKTEVSNATELQAAIKNTVGGEIVLADNITLTESLVFGVSAGTKSTTTSDAEYVLDLNGRTINVGKQAGSEKHIYAFTNNANLTIKGNGTINARGTFNYGTLLIENGVTINAIDGDGGYAVRNYEGSEFIMNGGTLATILEDDNQVDKGGYDATTLRVDEGASATINGGVIRNICDFTFAIDNAGTTTVNGGEITSVHSTVSSEGNLTINGGSFTCNGIEGVTAHALVAWGGSETTINGGSFDGKDNYNGFNVDAVKGSVVNISGGTFLYVHSGSLYGEGDITVSGGTFFDDPSARLAEGYASVINEDGTWGVCEAKVVIGTKGYSSLQAAVDGVKSGETITLIDNITVSETSDPNGNVVYYTGDKSFTIDLNEKVLTGNTSNVVFRFQKSEGEENTITIKNGTVEALENTWSAISIGSSCSTKTFVNLDGLIIKSQKPNDMAVRARSGAEFTMKNCTVEATNSAGGICAGGGNVVLEDVTVNQSGRYNHNSVALGISGGAKMTIKSGSYTSDPNNDEHGTWVAYVMSSGGTLEINGGTFNGIIAETASAANACGIICADRAAVVNINGGTFNSNGAILDMRNNVGTLPNPVATLAGGVYSADPRVSGLYASNLIQVAEGYVVNLNANGTYTVIPTILKDGAVLDLGGVEYNGTITVEGNVTIKGDTKIKTLKSTTGCTITIEDGKTLTLNNFSFGSTETAGKEYEIKGGTVVANYGFFQHGTYALRSNFETGYMYYSFGSDITVYGIFHSQGKGDGLDYVRGKLTIAKGGKSIHDKSLWVGQPASWGAMNASLIIEEDGYLQANSLSVYEGSSLTYSKDEDLKYNNVTGTEYIIKK